MCYTRIRIKYEELTGFSSEEIRVLMETGVVGEPAMTGPFTFDFASKVKQDISLFNAANFDHTESITIQKSMEKLLKGGNPGLGTHPLDGANYILEARLNNGLRIYHAIDPDRHLLIVLAYSKKGKSQNCVIRALLKEYTTRAKALDLNHAPITRLRP